MQQSASHAFLFSTTSETNLIGAISLSYKHLPTSVLVSNRLSTFLMLHPEFGRSLSEEKWNCHTYDTILHQYYVYSTRSQFTVQTETFCMFSFFFCVFIPCSLSIFLSLSYLSLFSLSLPLSVFFFVNVFSYLFGCGILGFVFVFCIVYLIHISPMGSIFPFFLSICRYHSVSVSNASAPQIDPPRKGRKTGLETRKKNENKNNKNVPDSSMRCLPNPRAQ